MNWYIVGYLGLGASVLTWLILTFEGDKQELKNALLLLVLVIVVFSGVFTWWLHSPEYQHIRNVQRMEVMRYLRDWWIYNPRLIYDERDNRQDLMEKWHITEEDLR